MSIVSSMEEFEAAWSFLEPSLDPKYEITGTVHTKQSVLQKIAAGEALIFSTEKAAVLIQVVNDNIPTLNAWASGGSLRDILTKILPEAEEWGRQNGFKKIMGHGRKQWGAAIAKVGFKPEQVIYTKEL